MGKPQLLMIKPTAKGFRFIADSELEFLPAAGKGKSVSLLGLKTKLTFKR